MRKYPFLHSHGISSVFLHSQCWSSRFLRQVGGSVLRLKSMFFQIGRSSEVSSFYLPGITVSIMKFSSDMSPLTLNLMLDSETPTFFF